MRILLLLLLCAACNRGDSPPPNADAIPGADKKTDTKLLETGASALQNLAPVRALDHYLDGFHVMKHDPGMHMEAHHYCKGMNEEFTQCVIFDGNTERANIIGIEYIISGRLYDDLPEAEKASWHPHNYEILSGQLVMPGLPDVAEKAALAKKINSYGKTWHVWDTGHYGQPSAQALPVGTPQLAWSYNRDGEGPAEMIDARDKRMQLSTDDKKQNRKDLAEQAKPQRGEDALRGQIKH